MHAYSIAVALLLGQSFVGASPIGNPSTDVEKRQTAPVYGYYGGYKEKVEAEKRQTYPVYGYYSGYEEKAEAEKRQTAPVYGYYGGYEEKEEVAKA